VPESSPGAPRLPDLRDVPWAGSSAHSFAGFGELSGPSPQRFVPLEEPVRAGEAWVFPGQGSQFVGMGKDV